MKRNNHDYRQQNKSSVSTIDVYSLVPHIHYDKDMESAVLGACLVESDAFSRIKGLVEPEHFYFSQNQAVFSVITEMWGDGISIDMLTVAVEIHKRGLDKDFSDNVPYYLTCLTKDVVSSAHIEQHSMYIRQMFAERECIRIQMEAASGEKTAVEKMYDIQEQIQKVLSVKGTDDWTDMATVMLKLGKHMDNVRGKDMLGITTGFPSLDKITSGLQPTQMVVIGARPSVGKTAFVAGLAVNAAQAGHSVGIINLEMPDVQIGSRLTSFYSDIEFWRIYRAKPRDQQQDEQIYQAMSDVANLPIWISDKTNVSGTDIRAKAVKLKKRAKLDLLIIDYLQLVEGEPRPNENREREVARLSRSLKLLAMDLKIPVLVLVQLNRESEKAGNKKPRMSNIRESGGIEQDADLVMLLHRDWKSGIMTNEHGESTETEADIIIEKNRNGPTLELKVGFAPDSMKFYEPTQGPPNPGAWKPIQNYSEPQDSPF